VIFVLSLAVVLVLAEPVSTARGFAGPTEAPALAAPEPEIATTEAEAPAAAPPVVVAEPREKPAAAPPERPRSTKIPSIRTRGGTTVQPWIRNTALLEWYRDNYNPTASDDGFIALVERLNVGTDVRTEKLTIGTQVRVDGQAVWFPGGRDCEGGTCAPVTNDARLERTILRLDAQRVGVQIGDFNVGFGRGMGLSVRRIDEIGIDATIKGGRFDLRTRSFRATALAGFANRQNSDFATRQLVADPGYPAHSYAFAPNVDEGFCGRVRRFDGRWGSRVWTTCSDLVAGSRLEATLPGRVEIGTHYAYVDFGDELTAGVVDELVHRMGGDIGRTRIAGVWDLFLGAAGMLRNPQLRGTALESQRHDGYAIYGSSTFFAGTTTVLVEGKHYVDDLVAIGQSSTLQYTENPTLERDDQQVPGNANATGGRVRVDHTWRPIGLTVYGNALAYAFSENIGESAFGDDGRVATHQYAGVIWRRPRSELVLQASAGYRDERFLGEREDGGLRRRFPHAEIGLSIPIARTGALMHAIQLRLEGRRETFVTQGSRNDFVRAVVAVGYALSPRFSITFQQGFDTTQPTPPGEPSLDGERCSSTTGSTCRPHLWPGVQMQINLFDASFLRVFAGRQMGGKVCVNGSCRTLPDFEGVRTELVLSF
jgi:hypothetical protein